MARNIGHGKSIPERKKKLGMHEEWSQRETAVWG